MPTLTVSTTAHAQMIDISRRIEAMLPQTLKSGICHVFCSHTTAGLTINENADPDVASDMLAALDKIVPWENSIYRHSEGNSAAHLKASMLGFSLSVPFGIGRLKLGTWQGIYLCEFDGPRQRRVEVGFIEGHYE